MSHPDTAQGKGKAAVEITVTKKSVRKIRVKAVPIGSCWGSQTQRTIDRMSPRRKAKNKCGICGEQMPAGYCVILFFKDYNPPNQLAHIECVPKEHVPPEEKKKP